MTAPEGVMLQMESPPVVQRFPSGPVVIIPSALPGGRENSVITPDVVMRPILFPRSSVNQTLPSGPATIPFGKHSSVGTRNSVMFPSTVIRPILLENIEYPVNQRFPSGPGAI